MYSLSAGPMRTADGTSELLPGAQVCSVARGSRMPVFFRRLHWKLSCTVQARMHKKLAQLTKVTCSLSHLELCYFLYYLDIDHGLTGHQALEQERC